jgi:hypothetical protein
MTARGLKTTCDQIQPKSERLSRDSVYRTPLVRFLACHIACCPLVKGVIVFAAIFEIRSIISRLVMHLSSTTTYAAALLTFLTETNFVEVRMLGK